jgi:hypothetical protein
MKDINIKHSRFLYSLIFLIPQCGALALPQKVGKGLTTRTPLRCPSICLVP